jgi:acetyl esterase
VARALARLFRNPEPVLAALGRSAPVERDGRVLNRSVQAMIESAVRSGTAARTTGVPDPEAMRSQLRRVTRMAMPVRTDVHASGRSIPGPEGAPDIPVRVYRQFGRGIGSGPTGRELLPAVVYLHGGGWVAGDLDTHDATCRMLAAVSRCLVVAVDYRRAPECPFPAAVEDAVAAYAWVQRHCSELGVADGRVGVMGDSAGGNLAAVVAQETSGGPSVGPGVPPPVAQGLVYPGVDARLDTPSLRSVGDGFFLTRTGMEYFRSAYLPDRADWESAKASPLLADDLSGLAPALVVTAGFDPLRDDGANYAEALANAGVEVEYRCYDDQIHGFMGMGILSDSLALATEVCDAMGRLMHRPVPAPAG